MIRFTQRKMIEEAFDKWATENGVAKVPNVVIAFLQINGCLDEDAVNEKFPTPKRKGEAMAKYIEREAFIAHIRKEVEGLHTKMPMDLVIEGVANEAKTFPAADVAPVRHGRWVDFDDDYGVYDCSECGERAPDDCEWNYCPNCGAKMDKEADE